MKDKLSGTLYTLLILLILLFFIHCKNYNGAKEHKKKSELNDIRPQIDGFFIFKKNMLYSDVKEILKSSKIQFRQVSLSEEDEINYPISWRYLISLTDLKNFGKIKILEGHNLSILGKILPSFQIAFCDDKIFYFNYERDLEENGWNKMEPDKDREFTENVNYDISILKVVAEGLEYKYGYPLIRSGNLNAFYPSSAPWFRWNNHTSYGSQFRETKIWQSRDSNMHIYLSNDCIRDTLLTKPDNVIIKGFTRIEVLFDKTYAETLRNYVAKKDVLDKMIETHRSDSMVEQKHKQFDSL